jgi:transposase InsO family protein
VNAWRADYIHVRPHEAIGWNTPGEVHAGQADPAIADVEQEENLPTT